MRCKCCDEEEVPGLMVRGYCKPCLAELGMLDEVVAGETRLAAATRDWETSVADLRQQVAPLKAMRDSAATKVLLPVGEWLDGWAKRRLGR